MKATIFPGASKAQWYADDYPGDVWSYPLEKWVWHTTETSGWPGYGGGKSAPTMTVKFDFERRAMDVRAHFPANMSARALQNDDGGVQTNRDRLIQVEIVGTCDPAAKRRITPFIPELPEWALRELAKLVVFGWREWAIPMSAGVDFVPYPASYGEHAPQRLHGKRFDDYRGHMGHEHVDENDHGDPGNLNMSAILRFAAEIVRRDEEKENDDMPTAAEILNTKMPLMPYADRVYDDFDGMMTLAEAVQHAAAQAYVARDGVAKLDAETKEHFAKIEAKLDTLIELLAPDNGA